MTKKRVEFVAYVLLFLFFVGTSFMLITLGAKVYQKIDVRSTTHYHMRTPLSYLRMKVRQYD